MQEVILFRPTCHSKNVRVFQKSPGKSEFINKCELFLDYKKLYRNAIDRVLYSTHEVLRKTFDTFTSLLGLKQCIFSHEWLRICILELNFQKPRTANWRVWENFKTRRNWKFAKNSNDANLSVLRVSVLRFVCNLH